MPDSSDAAAHSHLNAFEFPQRPGRSLRGGDRGGTGSGYRRSPRHVDDVRGLFLDHLTPGQVTLLAEISDLVLERIDPTD